MSLVLKVVNHDGTAYGGFQWNTEIGAVNVAPDWNPEPDCGQGLHGWLYGEGNLSASSLVDIEGAVWMVLDVDENTIVPLDGKVKFPSAEVVFKGERSECANYIAAHEKNARAVHFVNLTGGYGATLTGGDGATLTGGDGATLIFQWWDGNRKRITVGYVGEGGIKPNVQYVCIDGIIKEKA